MPGGGGAVWADGDDVTSAGGGGVVGWVGGLGGSGSPPLGGPGGMSVIGRSFRDGVGPAMLVRVPARHKHPGRRAGARTIPDWTRWLPSAP